MVKVPKFYGRRGTPYEVYFCIAPWVRIRLSRYLFERFVMRNKCLATETQMAEILAKRRTNEQSSAGIGQTGRVC